MAETKEPLRWYVLRSKPHKEGALLKYARGNGFEVFYPTIPYKPVNPRAARFKAYFPGYMFIRTEPVSVGISTFTWMPFSSGLVHVGGEPAPVPDLTMRSIATRVGQVWAAGGLQFDGLRPGDPVEIREGMFEGYEAIFDARLAGPQRVRVLLKMLNDRFVPVEIDASQIHKRQP